MGLAAIVLAAGASTRMGQAKQLMMIQDEPMINRVFNLIEPLSFPIVFCVTGAHHKRICEVIPDEVGVIHNKRWSTGLGGSIQIGINHVMDRKEIDGVFLFLSDQPFILTSDLKKMVELYSANPDSCIASSYGGVPGVPAIIPRRYFSSLSKLEGSTGAKSMMTQTETNLVLFQHSRELVDIDTIEDYHSAIHFF
ncbi:molybdenum cofactor cytidylyltransferase [Reichenbachiella agariperforans]|uniref:Molybdenum cofactor cytidylyltransferase n=1 Tax=Reichenbachiella agariperforans TaxID=156994 RepID=A0A1M6PWR8_REIAG|nr:nucleotidyltransferase family protein [Reichenbachiella agariperforans]SHK12336.1 molybdenum cofactor cytidylyltransferase [Reichenbachiella agariperforans]